MTPSQATTLRTAETGSAFIQMPSPDVAREIVAHAQPIISATYSRVRLITIPTNNDWSKVGLGLMHQKGLRSCDVIAITKLVQAITDYIAECA